MGDAGRIAIVFAVIIIVNLIGNAFPPNSIMFSPAVIALSAYLLFGTSYRIALRVGLFCLALVVNDLLLKNIAGGTHDLQGAGWINAMFILGVGISMIVGLVIFLSAKIPANKIIAALLGIALFSALHLHYFAFHGMKITLPYSDSVKESKEEGRFLRSLSIENDVITNQVDSVMLVFGWLEHEVQVDHKGLIKRSSQTGYLLGSILAESNSGKYRDNIYYKVNSKDVNGSRPVNGMIRFRVLESDSLVKLYFFDMTQSVMDRDVMKVVPVRFQ